MRLDSSHRSRAASRPIAEGAAPPAFSPPVRVKITRVEGDEREDLGVGTLIDAIVVGKVFRLSTGTGQLVATSAVREIRSVSVSRVEVQTSNSLYRLERIDVKGATTTRVPAAHAARRLADLRMRKARLGHTTAGQTGTVAVESEPGPRAGAFGAGRRVRVTRVRASERGTSETGAIGAATLLDDLEVGRPARFAADGQGAIVTSVVTSMQRIGARAVQVSTRNSSYRFDASDEDGGA